MADTKYSDLLKNYVWTKFRIRIDRIGKSWFRLPSNTIIYVNGSKLLDTEKDSYGWYDLGSNEYEKLITNSNLYYVIILDSPESTFILPHYKVKEIFSIVSPGADDEWHYKIRKRDSHYVLKPSNDYRETSSIHYIEGFLNRWTQIEDFDKIDKQVDSTYTSKDPLNIEKFVERFDASIYKVKDESIETKRLEFISLFSIPKIQQIDMDEYVVGKPDPQTGLSKKSTFCYHLENGLLSDFGGISGTPADKFGIYFDKENMRYVFDDTKFSHEDDAFNAVKKDILKILEIGRQFQITRRLQDLEPLDRVFNLRRHIIAKILATYYPDEFLQIYNDETIVQVLKLFGISRKTIPKNFFMKQQKLLELKNANSVMRKWSTLQFSRFLWRLYQTNKETMVSNITKDHIIRSVEEIDRNGVPKLRLSHTNLLEYAGKTYPPKFVVCLANKFANGREIDPDDLKTGYVIPLLRELGFKVVRKSDNKNKLQQNITEDDEQVEYVFREKIKIPDLDLGKFIQSASLDSISSFEFHSIPPPQKVNITDIIKECADCKWVLPNFQRYFEWKKRDVREFLESIFNNYYVGSLLFWKIRGEPQLDIMPISGVEQKDDELSSELMILDGQQRITSLYYAIKAPNILLKGSELRLFFYINFANFFIQNGSGIIEVLPRQLDREECFKKMMFPLYELEDYSEWISEFDKYMRRFSQDYDKIFEIRVIMERRLRHIREGFEIPYISLRSDMRLSEVTDIFEKINSSGLILNVFDLLIARLSKYDVDLKELWERSLDIHPKFRKYDERTNKMPVYILQAVSLYYNKTSACKREDILNIYQNIFSGSELSFDKIWDDISSFVNSAIQKLENLRDGYGVRTVADLPFAPMIPILAALHKEIENHENKVKCDKKMKIWYWSSVFSNAYSGAVDTQLTADFREMRDWLLDDTKIPKTVEQMRREFVALDLKQVHVKSSAVYKGVLSLLALNGANDFDTKRNLENARTNDKDHIFPRSEFGSNKYVDSILNVTWMSGDTNRKIKGFKRPSQYIKQFISERYGGNDEEFLEVLDTHFINKRAYEHMLNDDLGGFIYEREAEISSTIKQLIGISELIQTQTLITPNRPFSNKLAILQAIESCDDYIYWVDKYFSNEGLRLLIQSANNGKIKNIKILTSIEKADENLRRSFKDFRSEMLNAHQIPCELRVMLDSKLKSSIHDRWILSKNACFNIPSPDIIARGQYSEIKTTTNRPPFDEWWKNSIDIIEGWDRLNKG